MLVLGERKKVNESRAISSVFRAGGSCAPLIMFFTFKGTSSLFHKGRKLLSLLPLPPRNPQPCFASCRAEADYYERLLFSCVRSLHCST